jgi:succinate-semialdehyde dehydrogenase/glutarate-semialdehyde dehydrogenase
MATSNYTDTRLLINGEWCDAASGKTLDVINPATGKAIGKVAHAGIADLDRALAAAQRGFEAWRKVPANERATTMRKAAALVRERASDIGRLMTLEQGKPFAEARVEVLAAADIIEWFADEGRRVYGRIVPSRNLAAQQLVLKEPIGPVAAFTPWNFPVNQVVRKLSAALACGCSFLVKAPEETPASPAALLQAFVEAGVPAGTVGLVFGDPAEISSYLIPHPVIRKVTFTGSTPVGKHLARRSADTLKKLSLELGGNAPFIVFDDADVDAAVEGLMAAKFRNGGQTCVSPNRVFVQARVHDAFVDKLAARVGALEVGPATEPGSQIGPMINARAVEKIERHVRDAVARGARIVVGGERLRSARCDGPNYYAPTVLVNADATMACSCEETFGPVVPVTRFESEAEVIAAANDTPFGLAAYFYSRDVRRIWRVADALESGIVGINEGALAAEAAPFGGVKESGYGREGSVHGLDDYMHTKYVCQGQLAGPV